ncbi:hypothetical protein, partial [Streptomyces sp. NPDC055080]
MTLEAHGFLVDNAYSQSFIPYHEISTSGAGPGLVIETKQNGKVFVTAFSSCFSSLWLCSERPNRVAPPWPTDPGGDQGGIRLPRSLTEAARLVA